MEVDEEPHPPTHPPTHPPRITTFSPALCKGGGGALLSPASFKVAIGESADATSCIGCSRMVRKKHFNAA